MANKPKSFAHVLFCLLLLLSLVNVTHAEIVEPVFITKQEQRWLSEHQPIRVGIDGYFPPYSYINQHNQPVGMAVDTLLLIGKKIDIEFVFSDEHRWPNIIQNLYRKDIDIVLTMVNTPERDNKFLFTSPIVYKSLVVIAKKNKYQINNRSDIANKTIALVKGYQYSDKVIKEFPSVIPFYVDNMREAMEAVQANQADAAITFFAAANYYQIKYAISDLKFVAFYEKNNANEAIAIRSDASLLASIMQKGLDSLTPSEKQTINQTWGANITLPKDYQDLVKLAAGAGLLILLLCLWILQAKRHNKALVLANKNTENAYMELNDLKDNLQTIVLERTLQLTNSENRYRGLVESLDDEYIFYQHDTKGFINYISPSVTHILGHTITGFGDFYNKFLTENPKNQLISGYIERILNGEHLPPFEMEVADVNGHPHSFEVLERPMYDADGDCIGCEGIAHDVTARKQQQDELYQLSHYDDLTGLVNRYYFKILLDENIQACQQNQQPLALLFLDLTRLKIINDNFGHSAGDHILKQAATRINTTLKGIFTVSRFGGDKFCIALPNASADNANATAIELVNVFQHHFEFLEQSIILGCRVGISLFPEDGQDAESMLSQADSALYEAKKRPLGVAFCNKQQSLHNKRRLAIEQGLRNALAAPLVNDYQLFAVYQPLIYLPSQHLAGFEALMRWHHPEFGLISPAEFIPVAEDTGLIFELSRWMLTSVCQQTVKWHQQGFNFQRISVNLSALELMNINLADDLLSIISNAGAQPQWFKFEITETALMAIPEQSIEILQKLIQADIHVVIDDFGTGYSSLAYLKSLPAKMLKIDQSFINNLINSVEDQAVVKAVISMAHSLGKQVTAEGVELQVQLDFLVEHGCDVAQGYYFSKPISAEDGYKKYNVNADITDI
ncbi:EAL domain-containing protein [Shewanella livingstonensis]|uniref:EAL domain-containing protein n=1 Tax=Shewanella livingstonensis TaxID=150120 RepID=A0A3G8LU92_9GAMM|nr:EAL domain-containing protein [Shewanella livingstonensis]AZG73216.1 EAL domain-containing protein [Shewanella livingstonensis]